MAQRPEMLIPNRSQNAGFDCISFIEKLESNMKISVYKNTHYNTLYQDGIKKPFGFQKPERLMEV